MTHFIKYLILICLFPCVAFAQQTPETALYFNSWNAQLTVAQLTDTSFGPATPGVDYGLSGNNGRYAWTYIPVCDSNDIEIKLFPVNFSDSVGYSVYGPFQDTINILAQIQASTPILSRPYQLFFNFFFFPNQSRGIYYIAWNVSHFTGTKAVEARILNPQSINNLCGFCNSAFDFQQKICLITLDSATQRNQIIWDKGDTSNLQGFILFRENSIAGQYDSLTFIHKDSANNFIDMTANPAARNWRYMIHRYDQCGNRLPAIYQGGSYIFRTNTIHLQQGISTNNSINLTWNNSINNSPNPGSGGFIQSFYIYRSNGFDPFICIDSLPASNSTYTDVNPNQGLNLYQVAMRKITTCAITRSSLKESRSNVLSTTFTGLYEPMNHNYFKIYPNPANDQFSIEINSDPERWVMTIWSADGRVVYETYGTEKRTMQISTYGLAKGIYMVRVNSNERDYYRKLIVN